VLDRSTSAGSVPDCRDLDTTLALVPWTTKLNDGQVPSVCSSDPTGKHKLGFWKSEEFSKLALVALYALHSQVPKGAYESFCLLTRIRQLVFSKELRIDG